MKKTFDNLCEQLDSLRLNTKEVLTQEECSRYTGFAMTTLYGLVSARQIPHYKQGKKTFFRRSEIDEWLTSYRVNTEEEDNKRALNFERMRRREERKNERNKHARF